MRDQAVLQAMFECATIGVLIADVEGSILSANPFTEKIFGYEKGELTGAQVEDLLPADLRSLHKVHRLGFHENPKQRMMGANLELVGQKKDGGLFPVEISLGYIKNNNEQLVIAYINDVTNKKETNQELRRYKNLMDEVQSLAHLGSFDWDAIAGKITWSDETYRIFGFEPQSFEVTMEKYLLCVHPQDRDRVRTMLNSIRREKRPLDFEYRIVRSDGSIRYLKGIRGVELDRKGNFKRLYGLIQDVTNIKQQSIELKVKDMAITRAVMPFIFSKLDGTITDVNDAFVKMWGYDKKEELIGINNAKLSSSKEEITSIMEAIHKNGSWIGEARAIKKDGTLFDVYISSVIIFDDDGEPESMLASFIDITRIKQAEAINRDISKIVEESLNEIFIFDAATLKFTQVNKGARQNLGYSLEEIQQLTPVDIKPDFSKKAYLDLLKTLVEGKKEKLLFETIHERKDKTTYPVEIHLQLSSIGDQPVFVAIVLDIAERKRNEKLIRDYSTKLEQKVIARTVELSASEERLNEAQKIARLAYWEWDSVQGVVSGSTGLSQIIFGHDKKPLFTLKKFMEYVHPGDRSVIKSWIKNAWSKGKDEFIDFRVKGNPEQEIYLNGMINHARFDDAGKVKKLFGVVQDITERKKAEKQLEFTLEKERELSELKSRFVSMASHEFRTPLTSILASADLIEIYGERGIVEKQQKHIGRIKSSVNNLTSILNDFLSLEKLESGKIELNPEPLDFSEFISEIKEEIGLIANAKQQIHCIHTGSETACIDPHLVKNILINLLSNAIKYSPNGEDVHLISENANGLLNIQVKDHGIGIPEKDQKRMFNRFFRASNASAIKGTGLGLTIVKRYLNLMGGTISFTSVPNKETVFRVEIPVS